MPETSATNESSPRTTTSTAAPMRISGTTSKTLFTTDSVVAGTIRARCGARVAPEPDQRVAVRSCGGQPGKALGAWTASAGGAEDGAWSQ